MRTDVKASPFLLMQFSALDPARSTVCAAVCAFTFQVSS